MSFVLKIVRGANAGAEIALPEGVAVTLGKSDDCDIVLADATLPDAALTLAAAADGVTLDGAALAPFTVTERGATAFAVGPADAPWGELTWPEKASRSRGDAETRREEGENARGDAETQSEEGESSRRDAGTQRAEGEDLRASAPPREKKKRPGCLGCLLALILLVLVLLALGWFFRDKAQPYVERARPYAEQARTKVAQLVKKSDVAPAADDAAKEVDRTVVLAERYGLVATNRAGRAVLAGDFATRAARLTATAEAYDACPGIELDFCDDESLRTAAEDTFALVGEPDLRVTAVTNRVLALAGTAVDLRRTLEALAADLPKLRDVDVAGINSARRDAETPGETAVSGEAGAAKSVETRRDAAAPRENQPALPVCGILTTPYPCLVLKSGARVLEGAPFGDGVVEKIEADAVTIKTAQGRIVWRP